MAASTRLRRWRASAHVTAALSAGKRKCRRADRSGGDDAWADRTGLPGQALPPLGRPAGSGLRPGQARSPARPYRRRLDRTVALRFSPMRQRGRMRQAGCTLSGVHSGGHPGGRIMWATLGGFLRTLRIALPKVGVGWMFALLTIDFNRIAIVELGIAAIIVTTLLSLHYFLSPFQVIIGRFADTHPLFGYRRTPYLVAASVLSSLLFLGLPGVVHGIAEGSMAALSLSIVLFVLFGLCMATVGDCYHALVAEVTTDRTRSGVIAVVWITMILSTILASVVMNKVRPVYTPEAMQQLYNLTPLIVIGCTLAGVWGVEKRMGPQEMRDSARQARLAAPPGNPLAVAWQTLRRDAETRAFFLFVFISIFAIFLQDNILEVFGAEVFGMTVAETTRFQPTWGSGVLLGMVLMGVISVAGQFSKRSIVVVGCVGTAVGMLTLASASVFGLRELVLPGLFGMGLFTGIFNIGALSLMMEMTVPGATGLYMGLWGMSQVMAQGLASIGSGVLHTALVGGGLATPAVAYGAIFGIEAAGLVVAATLVLGVSTVRFRAARSGALSRADLTRAMETGSTA
jgi:BCD family chlorophyll transporter-like MFS transporter